MVQVASKPEQSLGPGAASEVLSRGAAMPWIDGAARPSATRERAQVINPATNEPIVELELAGRDDVDAAVEAAKRAFDQTWSKVAPSERTRLLFAWADALLAHEHELAALDVLEHGMPATRGLYAVRWAAGTLREIAGWAGKVTGISTEPGGNRLAYTIRRPLGVVGAIIPWNGPLASFVFKVAPALTAGCTIVVKPSELTPLSALRAAELAEQAGIPSGVINVVPGYGEVAGQHLARHHDVRRITFTGSTSTGRKIIEYSAGNIKRLNLELGGKSPDIIFGDADLNVAIPGAAAAIYNNAGQVCTAGSRLFVESSIYDEVLERLAAHSERVVVGPGFTAGSEIGPLISARQFDRVSGYVEGAKADGVTVVTGGGAYDDEVRRRGFFFKPTILTGVNPRMKVQCEEVFGPVLTVMPFSDEEEAIRLANDTEYGLAGMCWTRDLSRAHRVADRVNSGMFWVNCSSAYISNLPHSGMKVSGYGAKFGVQAIQDHLEERSVIIQL